MRKSVLLALTALLFSLSSQAQFRKLIDKAKEKAVEVVLGTAPADTASTVTGTAPAEASTEPQASTAEASTEPPASAEADASGPPPPTTIDFPTTGVTVRATHAVIAPVIDGDVARIVATPAGQYGISVAKEKGLRGTDVEIFKQLLDLKNARIMEEVDSMVELKFPEPEDRDEASSSPLQGNNNPAWGGISAPSLYFAVMVGSFDLVMTNHFIKTTLKHDHFTMAQAFGVNVVSISDLDKRMVYNIGSVLGVNYTSVKPFDTSSRSKSYSASMVLPLIKKQYLGIKGLIVLPGAGGKFGEYNTTSEKLIIPVQPYTDPESHTVSNSLLALHDILSHRDDAAANDGKGHYDPSFKVIYEYYYTHDFDKYLPSRLRDLETAEMERKGMCVGAAIEDENGNRAIYRITDVSTDNQVDQGQFQIPADYPVMSDDELRKAIRKKLGVDMLKGLIKPSGQHP